MHIDVSRYVFAPPDTVWAVLTDWEGQPEWMADAVDVEVLSEAREGPGVELRCPTRLFGFTVEDRMVVTQWEPPHRLGIRHTGRVIRGEGRFELRRTRVGTRVRWSEQIDPPLGPLGAIGAVVTRPFVQHVFGRSLDALKRQCERVARRERALAGGEGRG